MLDIDNDNLWLNNLSFEVQLGIMAACIPTLPAGYKWLRKQLRLRQSSSTANLRLVENPGFEPSKPPKAHRADRDISNALKSEMESARAVPNGIRRTITVDVERNLTEDSVDHEGKPSLEIHVGPRFESLRSLWAKILDAELRSRGSEGSFW